MNAMLNLNLDKLFHGGYIYVTVSGFFVLATSAALVLLWKIYKEVKK